MEPEDVMRDFWMGLRSLLLGLFIAGGVAFGAGYFTGVKAEAARRAAVAREMVFPVGLK